MEKAKRKFTSAKGWLTQLDKLCVIMLSQIDKGEDVTLSEMEHLIKNFEDKLSCFEDREEDYEDFIDKENELEEHIRVASEFRSSKVKSFLKLKEVIRRKVVKKADSPNDSSISLESKERIEAKLPKLELPKFSGDVTQWQSFLDRFNAIIDNRQDISDVNKFTYLLSLLRDEAKACVQGLQLTAGNYQTAKELLKKRFGRRETVVFGHIQKLLSMSNSGKQDLWKLYDELTVHVRSLENLGVSGAQYGVILTPLILHQLPPNYRLEWSREAEGKESDLNYLMTFLFDEIRRRERSQTFNDSLQSCSQDKKRRFQPTASQLLNPEYSTTDNSSKSRTCPFCAGKHYPDKCPIITNMSHDQRKQKIQELGLCFSCLSKNHRATTCNRVCYYCKGKHHSILHLTRQPRGDASQSSAVSSIKSGSQGLNSCDGDYQCVGNTAVNNGMYYSNSSDVSTLMQVVRGKVNNTDITILFDTGSDRSFIRNDTAKKLNLSNKGKETLSLSTFGDNNRNDKTCDLFKLPVDNQCTVNLLGIRSIASPMYRAPVPADILSKIQHIPVSENLACGSQLNIDVLIGLDNYWNVVEPGVQILGTGLVSQRSKFGSFVSGSYVTKNKSQHNATNKALFCQSQTPTEDTIRRCWELDAIGIGTNEPSDHDPSHCFEKFSDTITYANGRYQVSLPWKTEEHKGRLLDNYAHVEKRFKALMRKLDANPSLKESYNDYLTELEGKGIIEEVKPEDPVPEVVHYLPHRPVIRDESQTTKVRPVFDASARGENGVSLNDCMEVGQNLTPDLIQVLLRFRRWKYSLCGDVQRAFLQIELKPSDRDAQRFLWDVNDQIRHMRINRVAFGNASSPFLLNATIKHHLAKFDISRTVSELQTNLYVDDWLTGADTEEELTQMMLEAQDIMIKGSFPLSKWITNSSEAKGEIKALSDKPIEDQGTQKVLGVHWNNVDDCFQFSACHEVNGLLFTKRRLLGLIAQQFDPLGLLTPFTITLKTLFQETWRDKYEWDSVLPDEMQRKVEKWIQDLETISQWKIPRRIASQPWNDLKNAELIVFADASPRAYGCCVYLKTQATNTKSVNLIMSKAKVAPLKTVTLPRLELLAALLAARLTNYVKMALQLPDNTKTTCYTDSKITKAWIQGDANRWKQFVRNRVLEIQDLTDSNSWKYCPTEDNPADMLTRGESANSLIMSSKWIHGPEWLMNGNKENVREDNYIESEVENYVHEEELKDQPICAFVQEKQPIVQYDRFSSFGKLIRVMSLVLKFTRLLKGKLSRKPYPEPENPLEQAKIELLKQLQGEYYGKEIKELCSGKVVGPKSSIASLSPFMGDDGLIRVHGRLDHAPGMTYDERHPVLLPKCRVTYLLVRSQHEMMKHCGINTVITAMRNKYWIVAVRTLAKRVVKTCVKCQRIDKKPMDQTPAPLPTDRLSQQHAFSTIGIDYTGPLYCSDTGRQKLYILLFTCAVTRAIHLELTESMSTPDFVLAFRRFVSRRAMPSVIYSDNAKTFKSASALLQRQFDNCSFKWKFSIPLAPWYGGFWERLFRSIKGSLKKSLGNRAVPRSELETVLFEVEACINSRPLTTVAHSDPPHILTPSNFLIGRGTPLTTSELLSLEKVNSLSETYKQQKDAVRSFWEIWQTEYIRNLPPLKRKNDNHSLAVGSIVLIKEEGKPRIEWPLALILKLIPGRDGLIRAVQLKTARGNFTRAIKKLVRLEIEGMYIND